MGEYRHGPINLNTTGRLNTHNLKWVLQCRGVVCAKHSEDNELPVPSATRIIPKVLCNGSPNVQVPK